ncbi:MAG: DUF2062 domain-containing protein [Alphaproteobacteria bacterium]
MRFRRRKKLSHAERVRHFVWPRSGWRRAVLYIWRRVWRLSDSPHVIAIGFAAGAMASFTPFVGFHFFIGFCLAWVARGNLLASAFGTAVGNPLSFPLIWFTTYEVGAWMLNSNGHSDQVDLSGGLFDLSWDTLLPLLTPMLIGAMLLGPLAGLICYLLVKPAVAAYQARRRVKFAEHATRRAARNGAKEAGSKGAKGGKKQTRGGQPGAKPRR